MFGNEKINACKEDLTKANEILEDFKPLLLSLIHKYCFKGDREDLLQEGREEILKSILDFDGRVPFPGYLKSRLTFFYLNKMREQDDWPVSP